MATCLLCTQNVFWGKIMKNQRGLCHGARFTSASWLRWWNGYRLKTAQKRLSKLPITCAESQEWHEQPRISCGGIMAKRRSVPKYKSQTDLTKHKKQSALVSHDATLQKPGIPCQLPWKTAQVLPCHMIWTKYIIHTCYIHVDLRCCLKMPKSRGMENYANAM